MPNTNDLAAEDAAFRSFANSYLREIDPGVPVFHRDGQRNYDCTEIALADGDGRLRIEISSRSLCGPHRFGRLWRRVDLSLVWREVDPFFGIQLLVRAARNPMAGRRRDAELGILESVLLSYNATKRYLQSTGPEERQLDFIAAEQSLHFGHPLHPTPKSLQGMTGWHQKVYAPELQGWFQLHYFAVCPSLFRSCSVNTSINAVIADLLGSDARRIAGDFPVIPVHPLQAEALLLEPQVQTLLATGKLRALGAAGARFTATSSVRTVFSPDVAWMPKFSLPVRITNSKRVNKRFELDDGIAVARFFDEAGLNHYHPRLAFWQDRAYASVDLPGLSESGFEVIFRENPLNENDKNRVVTVSALTSEPLPGRRSLLETTVRDFTARTNCHLGIGARRWFEAYLDCALEPVFELYDRFGVGLEAHQQNSLLEFDHESCPQRLIYRDSQGFYVSNRLRERWSQITPALAQTQGLFFDDGEIQRRVAYYLVVNQIFGVIARMGHDHLASEAELLTILRERLRRLTLRLTAGGRDLARAVLGHSHLTAKANLITRLHDQDELELGARYIQMPNPLATIGMSIASEQLYAVAS